MIFFRIDFSSLRHEHPYMLYKEIELSSGLLSYMDTEKKLPTIVLIHGNSQSSAGFLPLVDRELGNHYRIVTLDLPGHGISHPANNAEKVYQIEGFASVLIELVDKIDLAGAIWLGHSLGGHILLNAISSLPTASGMMIVGTSPLSPSAPMSQAYLPNPDVRYLFTPETGQMAAEKVATIVAAPRDDPDPLVIEDYLRTDPTFRRVMGESLSRSSDIDDVSFIREAKIPVAVLSGEFDQIVNNDYLRSLDIPSAWRGSVQFIKGAGHSPHRDSIDTFEALVSDFADDVFAS